MHNYTINHLEEVITEKNRYIKQLEDRLGSEDLRKVTIFRDSDPYLLEEIENLKKGDAGALATANSILRNQLGALEWEIKLLKEELEGTDHLAANPAKWGLRAMFEGKCLQNAALEKEIVNLKNELRKHKDKPCMDCGF